MHRPWNHNLHFHPWLLRVMPAPCDHALDVGCGDGILTTKLAHLARQVTGIDVSPEMIAIARENAAAENITYIAGDLLTYPFPKEEFDFIAAVAVIHHIPLAAVLLRMSALLRRGGVLAVVGLARNQSLADYAVSALSVPLARLVRLREGWWNSPALRIDADMTYSDIKKVSGALLPGIEMRRRFFFRYTLLWRNGD